MFKKRKQKKQKRHVFKSGVFINIIKGSVLFISFCPLPV